jgi:hypothetical protein
MDGRRADLADAKEGGLATTGLGIAMACPISHQPSRNFSPVVLRRVYFFSLFSLLSFRRGREMSGIAALDPDSVVKQPRPEFTHAQLLSRHARGELFVSPHNNEGHGAPRGANVLSRFRHPLARRMVVRKRIALRRSIAAILGEGTVLPGQDERGAL